MRYDGDHKTTIFCGSSPDEWRSGGGLEPVERGVPLSPSSLDFEGFEEVEGVQGRSFACHTLLATQTVVCPPSPRVSLPHPSSSSPPVSGGERCEVLGAMVRNLSTLCLEFLRRIYGFEYSPGVMDFIIAALRESSQRQYESVWRSFPKFLLTQRYQRLSLDFNLRWLVLLGTSTSEGVAAKNSTLNSSYLVKS